MLSIGLSIVITKYNRIVVLVTISQTITKPQFLFFVNNIVRLTLYGHHILVRVSVGRLQNLAKQSFAFVTTTIKQLH